LANCRGPLVADVLDTPFRGGLFSESYIQLNMFAWLDVGVSLEGSGAGNAGGGKT
jgi:hypothetical protein